MGRNLDSTQNQHRTAGTPHPSRTPDTTNVLYLNPDPSSAEETITGLERELPANAVHHVTTPSRALESVRDDTPIDCVVSVAGLNGFTPIEFITAIHDIEAGLPVILVSKNPSREQARAAFSVGAAAYVQNASSAHHVVLANEIETATTATQSPERPRSSEHGHDLERYETMVETVPDGVYTLSPDFHFTAVNDGMVELTGYSRDELVGAHASLVLDDEIIQNAKGRRELLKQNPDRVLTTEYDFHTKTGEAIPCELRFQPLDFDDEYRGTAGVVRDISARKERERKLKHQRDALDELDRINSVIRDIDHALVQATTRDEIERAVCDRLAAADTYHATWIGEFNADYTELTPRTWAGIDDAYFDAARPPTEAHSLEQGPGATALRTRSIQVIDDVRTHPLFEPWRTMAQTEGYESVVAIPLVHGDTEYGVLAVTADRPNAFDDQEIAVLDELGETIAHALTAIDRKEYGQTLTQLHETTQALLHTDTEQDVSQLVIEAATEVLELPRVSVYRFDDATNTLTPVAASPAFKEPYGELTAFTAGEQSLTWKAFIDGEPAVYDDISATTDVHDSDTPFQSAMIVPLGFHGVVVVASPVEEAFDTYTQTEVQLLTATAEAAYDRLDSEANLRERDEALQRQNERLTRLNQINHLLRGVEQRLIEATTRDDIEQTVCDQLVTSDRFQFAWIGRADTSQETVVPQAWAGPAHGYLETVRFDNQSDYAQPPPAVATATTQEPTVVGNVASDLRAAAWRQEAVAHGMQSLVSVPLFYDGFLYGTLTISTAQADSFDELEQTVFSELGETIAAAISASETKRALRTDRSVELQLEFAGGNDVLQRIARHADSDVGFEGLVADADGASRLFFTARNTSVEAVRACEEIVTVDTLTHIATPDEAFPIHLFEADITERTLPELVSEHGGVLKSITTSGAELGMTLELSHAKNVRAFIEMLEETYPDADIRLLARRHRDRPVQTRPRFREELRARLSDRQREVLQTAYFSGFFDWPRNRTGQEIADALGVSQPTVNRHLRLSQREICRLLFDADEEREQ